MMTKKHNLEPFLSKPVELAQIADNVLVPKPVLILDVGRTRHTWARSQPSFSRGPVPPLHLVWLAVGHRWLSARGTHLRERHRKKSHIQRFSHSRGEGAGAAQAGRQNRRPGDHVGLRTRSCSPAAAIGLASSGEAGNLTAAEGTREARPRLPHELFPRPPASAA